MDKNNEIEICYIPEQVKEIKLKKSGKLYYVIGVESYSNFEYILFGTRDGRTALKKLKDWNDYYKKLNVYTATNDNELKNSGLLKFSDKEYYGKVLKHLCNVIKEKTSILTKNEFNTPFSIDFVDINNKKKFTLTFEMKELIEQ